MSPTSYYDPIREQYEKLSADGQVCHEADVEGYHLYFHDTSFGDGPILAITGHGRDIRWRTDQYGRFFPSGMLLSEVQWVVDLFAKAEWTNLLHEREKKAGHTE